jgi:hypothetical protein
MTVESPFGYQFKQYAPLSSPGGIGLPNPYGFDENIGTYLNINGNTADWNLGTTWTVEWRAKTPAYVDTNGNWVVMSQGSPGGFGSLDIVQVENQYLCWGSGNWKIPVGPIDQWNHYAIVKNAGTVTAFLNGKQQTITVAGGANANSPAPASGSAILVVGSRTWAGQYFQGLLGGIRITNTAVYTGDFSVPSSVPSNITGTKLLLNGGLIDVSGRHTLTNFGVTLY